MLTIFARQLMLCFCIIVTGCVSYQSNSPLTQFNPDTGYRYKTLNQISKSDNTDSLFVVLSFSGGGTRAAALSYGVLEELRNTKIIWKGKEKSLLDEVDIISSVSGGSFTSAYYGLYRDDIFNGKYEKTFLKHNVQGDLIGKLANPINWYKLAFPSFGRSDIANEYYQENYFGEKTFADLQRNGKPFLMINGTDMTTGAQFPLIQDQFDLLCSDLNNYPVSRAVTTSSAFPGLLTSLTYNNYAGSCDYLEPAWVTHGFNSEHANPERYRYVHNRRSYYAPEPYQKKRKNVHMMDGGVSDNIGLRSITFGIENTGPGYSILQKVNNKQIEKIVIITVNAATSPESEQDQSSSVPGFITAILTSATVPLDNYTFDTLARTHTAVEEFSKDVQLVEACNMTIKKECPNAKPLGQGLTKIDSYFSDITFGHIRNSKDRFWFKNIPTNFNLPPKTIDKLTNVGKSLLKESQHFKKLMLDIGAK